ncbi:lactate utilization protein C [Photobacterium frigidiphilum]|uniref:LutC/YkgG family protein n=1 Tax=Photobacterium frigidiphilum TaxID=264736 RepID=UPI003D1204CF
MSQIHNRDSFLDNIANKLGRPRQTEPVERPKLKHTCHHEVMAEFSVDELKDVLVNYTRTALGSQAIETTKAALTTTLADVCKKYCTDEDNSTDTTQASCETIVSADPRLLAIFDPEQLDTPDHIVHIWDTKLGYGPNIEVAERAKVGIVFAEQALAESGTMVLYSQPAQGRAISLLPEASIFVVPKSHLVARLTQATAVLHEKAKKGERLPSCVNFISGPSSTADIELIKVIGVHGPIYATYVIIDDM